MKKSIDQSKHNRKIAKATINRSVSTKSKRDIESAVKKVVSQYGTTLKMLAHE